MIVLLPRRVKATLKAKYGAEYGLLSDAEIIECLYEFDNNKANVEYILNSTGIVTKITYFVLGRDPIVKFIDLVNKSEIKRMVRSDSTKNYHDHYTNFAFDDTHPMYDLIVEVKYKYVYS